MLDYFGDPVLAVHCVRNSIEYRASISNPGLKTKFEKALSSILKNMCTAAELKNFRDLYCELSKVQVEEILTPSSQSKVKSTPPKSTKSSKMEEDSSDGEEGDEDEEFEEGEEDEEGEEGEEPVETPLKPKKKQV